MPYQIIYSSEATVPMQTDDLTEILVQARRSNADNGITGALVYADGVFLQILEGEKDRLQPLMTEIRRDVRHENVVILREGETPSAIFGNWKMAYVSATPQQVSTWAGLCVATGSTQSSSEIDQERHRTAKFAQDILSLLIADKN